MTHPTAKRALAGNVLSSGLRQMLLATALSASLFAAGGPTPSYAQSGPGSGRGDYDTPRDRYDRSDRDDRYWDERSRRVDRDDDHRGRYGRDRGGRYDRYDRDDDDDDDRDWRRRRRSAFGDDFGAFALNAGLDRRALERALSSVRASDDQRIRIRDLLRAARNEIETLQDRLPSTRRAVTDLLSKPAVDRGALEALRAERQRISDEISKRITQALADVADVLTSEQRIALLERLTGRLSEHTR